MVGSATLAARRCSSSAGQKDHGFTKTNRPREWVVAGGGTDGGGRGYSPGSCCYSPAATTNRPRTPREAGAGGRKRRWRNVYLHRTLLGSSTHFWAARIWSSASFCLALSRCSRGR